MGWTKCCEVVPEPRIPVLISAKGLFFTAELIIVKDRQIPYPIPDMTFFSIIESDGYFDIDECDYWMSIPKLPLS